MLDHSFSRVPVAMESVLLTVYPQNVHLTTVGRNAACGFEIRDDKQPLDNDKGTLHMCIGGLMIALMYSACLL